MSIATEIILTSEITVKLMQSMGGDHMLVAAARVSTSGEDAAKYAEPGMEEGNAGLINYLISQRHGTPAEHSAMTFFVHAPAFVWWEWVRHRVGQSISCPGLSDENPDASFNLESARYRALDPVFWVPRPDRPMAPAPGHKPARPKFVAVDADLHELTVYRMRLAYQAAWSQYRAMLDDGIASEVARAVLGFGVYYSGWVTVNPRSLMSFLSLRTHDPSAKFVSYPQYEIQQCACIAEKFLAEGWPITYASFVKNGRVAP